jgi:hypothetical protein
LPRMLRMLSYERRVVAALLTDADPARSRAVTGFVGGSLGAMPEHLRLGISGISIALGAWSGARRAVGRGRSGADEVAWLEDHPVGLVRQWLRALRSLVTFAEQESLGDAEAAAASGAGA